MSFEDAYQRGLNRAEEVLSARADDTNGEADVVPLDTYDVQTAALEAFDAGLCPIRAQADGTKRPFGEWKCYQEQPPDRESVTQWFADGYPGWGVVCGRVSGNLEMFELEGRAVTEGLLNRFKDALREASLFDLWKHIVSGYSERTPSNGLHVLYRCEDISGNLKLARRPATDEELARDPADKVKVLIETRGEGGFSILAPSNGTTHPSGEPWVRLHGGFMTIVTISPAQRAALLEVARSFDSMPYEEPERVKPLGVKGDGGTLPGFDLTTTEVLEAAGFTLHHVNRKGDAHWTRPAKPVEEGHSLTVWGDDGRVTPFSSSIDMPNEFTTGKRLLTAWQLHVGLNHRGDFTEAGRQWRTVTTGELIDLGDISPWGRRTLLTHIETFARARRCSPWAVLGVTLTRLSAAIPPFVVLPPLVGGHLSLNLFLNLVGASGAGKDAAIEAGRQAFDVGAIKAVGLGSGEGILDQYVTWRPPDPKKDDPGGIDQHTTAVLFMAPEVESLGALRGRSSATLMPELRKAWMGSALGFAYASRERRLFLDPHTYRLCLIVGVQPDHADILLGEAAGGTPQRFLWMPATDPLAPDTAPAEPPRLPSWCLPKWPTAVRGFVTLDVCETARRMVDEARIARLRGEGEALDGHALACRLKVAAILGIADGRPEVSEDDWALAGLIQLVSDRTRASAEAAAQDVVRRSNQARGEARAEQQIIVAERLQGHESEVVERVAQLILDKVTNQETSRNQLRRSIAHRDRNRFDEAIEWLIDGGLIEVVEVEYRGQSGINYRFMGGGQ